MRGLWRLLRGKLVGVLLLVDVFWEEAGGTVEARILRLTLLGQWVLLIVSVHPCWMVREVSGPLRLATSHQAHLIVSVALLAENDSKTRRVTATEFKMVIDATHGLPIRIFEFIWTAFLAKAESETARALRTKVLVVLFKHLELACSSIGEVKLSGALLFY